MKLNLKERKGITLIALVITIIVLLILAGVSIAMLTGQNGILTQAQNAKTTNENKSAEEKVKLAIMAAKSQSTDGSLELDKLTTEVTTNYGGQVDGEAFPATVTIDGKSFIVDSDGNVELTGAKPQITNTKITTNVNGTGDIADNTAAEGATLYITFGATLENGTITKVVDNDGNKEMTASNGIYSKAITKNGTYTFTITGTGKNGEVTTEAKVPVKKYETKILSASDISGMTDKSKIYGATVTGYTLPSGTTTDVGWKIFYADNSNIYLIADNYVERNNLPNSTTESGVVTANKPNDGGSYCARSAYFANILGDYAGSSRITDSRLKALNNDYFNTKNYTSTNDNMKAVAYMMDTKAWNSKFLDSNKADYCIGGPSVELLFKSYNEKYKTAFESQASSANGYQIRKTSPSDSWANNVYSMLSTSDPLYVIPLAFDAYAYWVASPSANGTNAVMLVNYNGDVNINYYGINGNGFRPLVCLKSNIKLQKVSNTQYAIQ